ncbi:MAG TPA: hypothetical protein VIF62_21245, partial [Labilithrix sp.]
DVATAVLAPAWASLAPESAYEASHERALLAVAYGDFDRAESELAELARAVEGRAELAPHVAYGLTAIAMKLETNDARAAEKIASEHLRRLDVWATPPHVGRNAWGIRQFVPTLLAAAPDVPAAERETRLAAWRAWIVSKHADPLTIWAYGDATFATTKPLAEAALARMPAPPTLPSRYAGVDLLVGRTLLLADRPTDAIPHLRAAATRCDGAEQPFEQLHARLLLTRALGPTKESCALSKSLASRWPKSLTGTEAASRPCPLTPDP